MADFVFHIARGKVNEYVARVVANDPTNAVLVGVVLATAEADATLEDYNDLGTLLAGSSAEATNTGYARPTWIDTECSVTTDDANDRQYADADDKTFTSISAGDNWVKILICYDSDSTGGTDSNIVPLVGLDYVQSPSGGNIPLSFGATGFYIARKP